MKCHQHLERNCGTFETIFVEKKVVHQFFDGFTFRTFGGLFEAIFYEEKVVRQFVYQYNLRNQTIQGGIY